MVAIKNIAQLQKWAVVEVLLRTLTIKKKGRAYPLCDVGLRYT